MPSLVSPFKSDVLKGKVVLITGGGSGIGFEIARQLGLHGASIAIMGRREAPLQAAVAALGAEGVQAVGVSGDVRKFEDCKKIVEATVSKFGKLDILVNNAAGNFLAPAEDLTPNGFKTVIEIDTIGNVMFLSFIVHHLLFFSFSIFLCSFHSSFLFSSFFFLLNVQLGVFHMCQAAFPHLKTAGDSLIINISATLHYGATWYQSHASAAKAAIDSLTRSFALEWGEYGIRVNAIAPGPIANTAGLTKLSGGKQVKPKRVPIRRFGETWDIAMVALFLATAGGSLITGAALVADGGAWLYSEPLAPRDIIREMSKGIEKKSRETGIPAAKTSKL